MTAEELLKQCREQNPGERYARHRDGTAVAGWNRTLGRWQIVAGKAQDNGEWLLMRHELLINGKPFHNEPNDWIE